MFKNYIKFTLRSLRKLKVYMLFNLLGLTVGISCALLAVVFFLDETSFDKFHSKSEQLFRVVRTTNSENGVTDVRPDVSGLLAPTLAEEYPEVKAATRLIPWFDEAVLSYEQRNLKINQLVFADQNFFETFDFELLRGNPADVLTAPNSIVLTESVAESIFGTSDPIGRTIIGLNDAQFNITGIVADPPENSHILFSALVSWSSTTQSSPLSFRFINNWLGQTVYTYLEMTPGFDQVDFEARMNQTLNKNLPQKEGEYELSLQPFTDVYLGSSHMNGSREVKLGSSQLLKIFGAIAAFILIIACLNYINISTSKAAKRAQEIGVRKVLGATRRQLTLQFIGDAFVLCLISTLLAILLVDLFIPYFNSITGKSISSATILNADTLVYVIGLLLSVSLFAGFYPALVLSSMKPLQSLKKLSSKGTRGFLRQSMMVFQFSLSAIVIIGAVVVYQQNDLLMSKDLGFNKEQLIVMNLPGGLQNQAAAFKNELATHADILMTSNCQAAIGDGTFSSGTYAAQSTEEISTEIFRVDFDFIKTWQLEMAEGRDFDPNQPSDAGGIIVNEAMLKAAGWTTGLGKNMRFQQEGGQGVPIIGVVKDFNYAPLTAYTVSPAVLYIDARTSNMTVRVSGNNMRYVLDHMETSWAKFEERVPFTYYFVDQHFAEMYEVESKFFKIIMIFSIISIFIACLGLYGLTAFTIEQKTKEIGIRKVLGAGLMDVLYLINKKFAILIVVAFALAIPVGYWAASEWLNQFPYRISIGVVAFIAAGLMVFVVAALTTSHQAFRASKMDPVTSLRYE